MKIIFKENDGKYRILANLHSVSYVPGSNMVYVEGIKHTRGFEVMDHNLANQIIAELYTREMYDFSDFKIVR